MPSSAAHTFATGVERARTLRGAAADKRLKPLNNFDAQSFYHAGLAAIVAAWDAYLNEVVLNFYGEIARPMDVAYSSIFDVANENALRSRKRFNTPNWDNARMFLVETTGYDPISDWIWARRGMSVQNVRDRLDQVLKVRHSFAHGFQMPTYHWNTAPSGRARLTAAVLKDTEAFFFNLVSNTDKGLVRHVGSHFGRVIGW